MGRPLPQGSRKIDDESMIARGFAEAQKRCFAQLGFRCGARTHGRKLQGLMETISPSVFPIVVELGSDTGLDARALLRKGYRVVATDLSYEIMYQARKEPVAPNFLIRDAASLRTRNSRAAHKELDGDGIHHMLQ